MKIRLNMLVTRIIKINYFQVDLSKIKNTAGESKLGLMAKFIKEIGKTVNSMGKDSL